MEASNVKGPITLIQGKIEKTVIEFAARLTLRYSDASESLGEVIYGKEPNILNKHLTVEKATQEFLIQYLL
jgi:predicted ribosome quality control (RQC) complex YloA/Tae2 family protein